MRNCRFFLFLVMYVTSGLCQNTSPVDNPCKLKDPANQVIITSDMIANKSEIEQLVDGLKKNQTGQHLVFRQLNFSANPESTRAIFIHLTYTSVKALHFEKCDWDGPTMGICLMGLWISSNISCLDINENTNLIVNSKPNILDFIQHTKITHFKFNDKSFDDAALAVFFNSIGIDCKLKSLVVHSPLLGKRAIKKLSEKIGLTNITELDIYGGKIMTLNSLRILFKSLENTTISHFHIGYHPAINSDDKKSIVKIEEDKDKCKGYFAEVMVEGGVPFYDYQWVGIASHVGSEFSVCPFKFEDFSHQ